MKYIVKHPRPQALADWMAQANENWQPDYGNMPTELKGQVRRALMAEQGGICCYCEQELIDRDSHIEHLVPQRLLDQAGALDYGNMLCSCQREVPKGAPLRCGNAKNGWYEPGLMVSPLDPGCEARFAYTGDGRIMPSAQDRPGAKETIDRLNLDGSELRRARARAIAPFLDGDISNEQVRDFAAHYLHPQNGQFAAFYTTIRYLFS